MKSEEMMAYPADATEQLLGGGRRRGGYDAVGLVAAVTHVGTAWISVQDEGRKNVPVATNVAWSLPREKMLTREEVSVSPMPLMADGFWTAYTAEVLSGITLALLGAMLFACRRGVARAFRQVADRIDRRDSQTCNRHHRR